MTMKTILTAIHVIFFTCEFCNIRHVEAAGRTISDYRIRDKDLTPVLGRGFSLATGTLQSSCLDVVARTKPTYNYDYYFTQIDSSSEKAMENSFEDKFKGSFSFMFVKVKIKTSMKQTQESSSRKTKRHIVATMRAERYYDSVDEVNAKLSTDAYELLESGQYISFFQACGPNYIRSIRRAQEVTAIFEYESESSSGSREFEKALMLDISGMVNVYKDRAKTRKSSSHTENSSLKISIVAYGLGLNEDGAGSLVAKSIDDYSKVMDFAFSSMQAEGIGMVQGIEIIPWVDNPQFQVAAGLANILQDCGEDKEKEGQTKVCKSTEMEIKKLHLSTNGEYVATMNRVMRMNIDKLYNLQQCRSVLHSWPEEFKDKQLINVRTSDGFIDDKFGKVDEGNPVTVGVMKEEHINAEHMEKQQEHIRNYIEHFYSPCISALSAEYMGQIGGISMIKSWFMIDECKDVMCTVQGATIDGGTCSVDERDVSSIMMDLYCMPILAEAAEQV